MPDTTSFNRLIQKLSLYHPSKDFSMVERAYNFAKRAHSTQLRKSGEPYIIHPLEVANLLADLELDIETIVAGILHDVIEDTEYSFEEVSLMFNEEVAELVDGVTKLTKLKYVSKEEVQAENYRKMFLAMAKDIRVILIKLADRLHNMRTLKYMTKEKQIEKAEETLSIYAPLAHKLGISKIKIELEDLCFRYLEPDAYYDLVEKIALKRGERVAYIEKIILDVQRKLNELNIDAKIEGRAKHFFSIYKKMVNQHKTIDQIFDLFAIRAVVHSVKDCYAVLGVIHEMYKPVPGRFKDYIAMPKPNMYQSLHSTLIGPGGEPFEIQIRTYEMHRTSVYGIAAHWKYKSGNSSTDQIDEKLVWLGEILEWQRDMSDNSEFMDALKLDLNVFDEQVYAFSPKGDVVSLQRGSTPIDFAYAIHSAVGNKMVGAKINGKIVTFDYKIRNGDRIEVITSQNSRGPSRDWLKLVKTSQARNKINQWFKKELKYENILKGKELLEKDAKKKGIDLNDLLRDEWIEIILRKYGFRDWDALCSSIGHGGLKEGQVIHRLKEEYEKEKKKNMTAEDLLNQNSSLVKQPVKKTKSGIIIKGIGDMSVRFSKCCNPVPGDEIVGFITRGRGVTIHRTDCYNIVHLTEEDKNRLIEAEWYVDEKEIKGLTYQTEIKIVGMDRPGFLIDVSMALNEDKIPVISLNARAAKNNIAVIDVTITISGKAQLEILTKKLMKLKGIHEIIRVNS